MKENTRRSNFELLRIICMIMIVTLHTLGHGGALKNTQVSSANFFVAHLLESLSIVAVNCYILISGFFGINSKFKIKKVLDLYIQVLFYSIIISSLFWIIGIESISLGGILQAIFPITMQTWWFMSIYLVLYILTPYINKLLQVLSFKEFSGLLIVLLFIFVIWPSIPKFRPIDIQGGYGLYSFIVLYTVGAYISKFYKDKTFNKYALLVLYLLSATILAVINVSISRIIGRNWGIYAYNFLLIFISSIVLFLFFKEIKIKSKFINKLSSLTLGVYLIHDHGYIRKFIYNALGYDNYFNTSMFILYTLIVIGIIYISSSIVEYLRQVLFNYLPKPKYEFIYGVKDNINYRIEKINRVGYPQ